MPVRPFTEADIPRVAGLYWTYMRRRSGMPPSAITSLFHELFLTNPFVDPQAPSLVYDSAERGVVGFVGGGIRSMSFCGKPLRVLFGGNLVVHPDFRSGLAAARLVNAFKDTNWDVALVDSANNISKHVLERMGYHASPSLNIHWRRPLHPSRYALYGLSVSSGSSVLNLLAQIAKPFCSVADAIASRMSASPFRQTKSRLHGEELDIETLLKCLNDFHEGYALWPEYSFDSLQWLIRYMERRPARGILRRVVVRDENQKIVGWYIYYVRPGAVGEVVQVWGAPASTKDILDHLFWDATENGVIGLHGVVDSRRTPDFSDKGCFFTCRGGWTLATAHDPEIMKHLERGDAFLSRLDGEWCLDPGD